MNRRSKRRFIRWALITGNFVLLIAIGLYILNNRSVSQSIRSGTVNSAVATASSQSGPLDELSSAQIAYQVAKATNLPESLAIKNQADSESALLAIVPSDPTVIAKPQVVGTKQKSKHDIKRYVSRSGDTISRIASTFGVSANSIRWSNGIEGDVIGSGKKLLIPPDDGVVYKVRSGDTIDSIVSSYRANKSLFVTVNDAEGGSLKVGDYIWIPNGVRPAPTVQFASYSSGYSWGFGAVYEGNGYDPGWCTWWAAKRRADIGSPVPSNLGNAITWKSLAQRAGLSVGTKPSAGAVIWTPASYGWGHVGFVEKVNDNGSVWVSDMNSSGYASMNTNSGGAGGWGRVSYRLLSPSEAKNFWYIY